MPKISKRKIIETASILFAKQGISSFSVRRLANELQVSPSLIYYYFKNEDDLLSSMFHHLNHELGIKRAALPHLSTAKEMLKQRVEFQFEHQTMIVAVLKYYLQFRQEFSRFKEGFLPNKSSLHIEEVLQYGVKTGEFTIKNIENDAKVITHAINGYLLEFFPYQLQEKEKEKLVESICSFLLRAL